VVLMICWGDGSYNGQRVLSSLWRVPYDAFVTLRSFWWVLYDAFLMMGFLWCVRYNGSIWSVPHDVFVKMRLLWCAAHYRFLTKCSLCRVSNDGRLVMGSCRWVSYDGYVIIRRSWCGYYSVAHSDGFLTISSVWWLPYNVFVTTASIWSLSRGGFVTMAWWSLVVHDEFVWWICYGVRSERLVAMFFLWRVRNNHHTQIIIMNAP